LEKKDPEGGDKDRPRVKTGDRGFLQGESREKKSIRRRRSDGYPKTTNDASSKVRVVWQRPGGIRNGKGTKGGGKDKMVTIG